MELGQRSQQALGWEEGVSRQCKTREAGAESSLGHTIVLGKSMSSAGMLGEESLWRRYMPTSRDWCVSH